MICAAVILISTTLADPVVDIARRGCKSAYPQSPCLKKLTMIEPYRYHAICTKPSVKPADKESRR
jgi:hypothetical protein